MNNKLTRIDAQLIVCLAGLMGLRPSEIVGLCWEDVNIKAGKLRLHQAYVRGNLGTTKTDIDVSLPMLKMMIGLFKAWHQQCGEPSESWVFPNLSGEKPINIRDYVVSVLRPAISKNNWKSLYAFRPGTGTILTELTGTSIARRFVTLTKRRSRATAPTAAPTLPGRNTEAHRYCSASSLKLTKPITGR